MSRERAERPEKLTVVLPAHTINALSELSERRNSTRTDTVKKAIATEIFFSDQMVAGREVLIFDPETQQTTRIIWPDDYLASRTQEQ